MPRTCKAVIFDLDGTLLNTLTDLVNAGNHVLKSLNLPTHSPDEYRYFVGNGIEKLVHRILPPDSQDIFEEVLLRLRQYYSAHGYDHSAPYPGITELLDCLSTQNIPFAVLSNKPDKLTKANIAHFFSDWQFHTVAGATPEYANKPEPDHALAIAASMGINPEDIFFVGDSSIDMQTATRAGMTGLGALWGFRTAEELSTNGAQILLGNPMELCNHLTH